MSLLSPAIRDQLHQRFEELDGAVTVVLFEHGPEADEPGSEACGSCPEAIALAKELAELSERIGVEVHDLADSSDPAAAGYHVDRAPAWVLLGPGRVDFGIRFFGIPGGYDFSTIVADLMQLSKSAPDLSPETIRQLAGLDSEVVMRVFVTPTCPYCPQAVYLAHQMAMASSVVTAEAFEATEFPDLVQRYQVRGVPKTVLNDTLTVEGAVPEQHLLEMLTRASLEGGTVALGA
ncbi:MAG: protein disulfide oxidoreductase [Candidatus Dormibacteria bacterium]